MDTICIQCDTSTMILFKLSQAKAFKDSIAEFKKAGAEGAKSPLYRSLGPGNSVPSEADMQLHQHDWLHPLTSTVSTKSASCPPLHMPVHTLRIQFGLCMWVKRQLPAIEGHRPQVVLADEPYSILAVYFLS